MESLLVMIHYRKIVSISANKCLRSIKIKLKKTQLLRIASNQFETMLRIEIGNARKTIYLEHSTFESGADIRIQLWNDWRRSGIGEKEKPELQELQNEKIIRGNDIITESEWFSRTWAGYLSLDKDSLSVEDTAVENAVMKVGISAPKAGVYQTSLCAQNELQTVSCHRICSLMDPDLSY